METSCDIGEKSSDKSKDSKESDFEEEVERGEGQEVLLVEEPTDWAKNMEKSLDLMEMRLYGCVLGAVPSYSE